MQIRIQKKVEENEEERDQIIRRPAGDDWF